MYFVRFSIAVLSLFFVSNVFAKAITPILPDTAQLHWIDVTTMPKGAKVAILMGNPEKHEPFIARILLPAGYTVPVHSHPVNENDTVISGIWYLGSGSTVNFAETKALPAGSFVSIPAHLSHYGMTKEETILQVSGMGPWGMLYPKG